MGQRSKDLTQGVKDPCTSAQVTSNFRVQSALRGVPLGVVGCSPLQSRGAQRAFLGTTVY